MPLKPNFQNYKQIQYNIVIYACVIIIGYVRKCVYLTVFALVLTR